MSIEKFAVGEIVRHGAYGAFAALEMARHYYAGADADSEVGGYFEVLEFEHPPEGKPKVVLHSYRTDLGSLVIGFETVGLALGYKLSYWRKQYDLERIRLESHVIYAGQEPWFYRNDT